MTLAADDAELMQRLLDGDEVAFSMLVDRHHGTMLRVAATMVPTAAVAAEVVQETWLAVIEGLRSFEGRSSLKTWIFRILTYRARTRGSREHRSLPFSSLGEAESEWALDVPHPGPSPETIAHRSEVLRAVEVAIDALPESMRAVILLRDVGGWEAEEVCSVLEISETNQRVILHRARSRVRAAVEKHLKVR